MGLTSYETRQTSGVRPLDQFINIQILCVRVCVSSLSITKHLHLTKTFAYQQWAETIEKYTQNTYRNYEKLRYMPYLHKYHQEIYIYYFDHFFAHFAFVGKL